MSQFDLNSVIGDRYVPRVLTLVETLNMLDPDVMVSSIAFPDKTEYENIQWSNSSDKITYHENNLVQARLDKTKEVWITKLMDEANRIQEAALALHTITDEMPLHQKSMYQIKYDQSQKYVTAVNSWFTANAVTPSPATLPTHDQVTVPKVLANEAKHTGDPVYYLAQAIIANFDDSEDSLQAFYGEVEGVRRVKKQEIVGAANIQELEAISWIEWPVYEGNPPNPKD